MNENIVNSSVEFTICLRPRCRWISTHRVCITYSPSLFYSVCVFFHSPLHFIHNFKWIFFPCHRARLFNSLAWYLFHSSLSFSYYMLSFSILNYLSEEEMERESENLKSKVIKKFFFATRRKKLVSFPGFNARQLLSQKKHTHYSLTALRISTSNRSSLRKLKCFFSSLTLLFFCEFPFCVMRYWISCDSLRIELSETHTHTQEFYRSEINLFIASFDVVVDFSILVYRNLIFLSFSLTPSFFYTLTLAYICFSSSLWLIKKQYKFFCPLPCIFFALNSISKSSFCQGLGNYSDLFHSVLWW
jgi:hypothetical protein